MKTNKTKYMIAAAALFLAAAMSTIEAKAQLDFAQNTTSGEVFEKSATTSSSNSSTTRAPFANTAPPSYAPPPGGGDPQKEMPVYGGLWILAGLGISYGIISRKWKKVRK